HESTPEAACGFRLRRGRGLHEAYMACGRFDDPKFEGLRRLRCGLFDWGERVRTFPKWGSVAWACRAATGPPTMPRRSPPSMPRSRPASPYSTPATSTVLGTTRC